ncbi:Cu/Ag efflux protein CusF [Paraburkholderia sp. BL8N3]|nr:copper-binding protein [Paraburkholderia sp. BL8N3]TCK33328.1 Cu/Ag efflux protein CusF [Paraburkholderia sp. BL8N3]
MKKLIDLSSIAGFLVAASAFAVQAMPSKPYQATAPMVADGQVVKLERATALVAIRQTMPKNVGMVPLTTVFRATDPAMLGGIHEGDKVEALVERLNGQPVILKISRRPWPIQ